MDEDAADGPGRPRIDWDDLTPAVERVGPDADTESADADTAASEADDSHASPSSDPDTESESASGDSDETEPTSAEPEQTESDQTEPAADEPAADESEQTESDQTEPAADEPAADESEQTESDQTEPAADEPAADEPAADESEQTEPESDGPDTDDPDELAQAVIQADEASWQPDTSGPDETTETDSPDAANDETDEWDDLTPAVERVAPTPAVERVAPTPAITPIEETEEDASSIEEASAKDFTNPTADIGDVSDTIGGQPTTPVQGPQSDQEQPLAVHIEEMVKRLGIVVAVAGAVSLALFPLTGDVINFLWYSILPGADVAAPHVYHPLEYKLTQLKTASLGGLLIALPVFVYQTYRFMRPGLYPHERRYYLASVPTSLILGLLGVTFAYFIVLPAIMSYFLYYSEEVVTIAFALGATFHLILLLMGYLAVVFQIPLFVMLAIMMGLTTREWLEGRRLIFWGAFLGIAFLFSPDPTGMAPVLVAATMVVLFEGTLLLLRWTGR